MSGNIQDKVVLITGGGSGIGAATARLLGSRGACVAVAARRKDKVDSVADLKHGSTGVAQPVVMQLYQSAIPAVSVARAIAFAIEQPADVDINEIVLRPTNEEF